MGGGPSGDEPIGIPPPMPIPPPDGAVCTGAVGGCALLCDTGAAAVLAGVIASLAGTVGDGASGGGAPPEDAA